MKAASVNVVLFSGGRGSEPLARQLLGRPHMALTIAINGYDDGASTGAIRRWLGDSLGPSDFRKNASRAATQLRSCSPALIELLDRRLPAAASMHDARLLAAECAGVCCAAASRFERALTEIERSADTFDFADCSVGNLVFAGGYLQCARDFNRSVDDYCALVGLPAGLIENVSDGRNAWLAALDETSHIIPTEAAIVGRGHAGRLEEIFLLADPLTANDIACCGQDAAKTRCFLQSRSVSVPLNPRLAKGIECADLIIYAPGTQHSSLLPSYLTTGLSAAIAANLLAIKLLLTNIHPDADTKDSSAAEIVERALYYLTEKGRLSIPTPCLITHYLVNDAGFHDAEAGYVPLGHLEAFEDPRLVRIGNYEDGISGRHDASKVLTPFLDALDRRHVARAAVLLHDPGSTNKLVQTLLEMVRAGVDRLPLVLTVFYMGSVALDRTFLETLPMTVTLLPAGEADFHRILGQGEFDYAILFESSGMYRGEDLVAVASMLGARRLDAVWGSRRLSIRDIEASYRFRYRRAPLMGLISFVGSHLLSLAYLALFGRYVSDTLSGVRAIDASVAASVGIDLTHKDANHYLLSQLLRRKADILELPVQFLPLSPERVKRTTVLDGLRALWIMLRHRFSR